MKRWRRDLQEGEFPLLSASQLQFLDEVNTVVDSKFSNGNWYLPHDEDRATEVMLQISALEENLSSIIAHLRKGRLAKLKFAETYPRWKKNREDCIVKLSEIATSLNEDRFNCNISKLVGYCTSILGGGVTVASAVLIPFTAGLTTPLAIAGGSMIVAGAGTAVGTSVTEVVLLKSKVDEAKNLIEEDKKYFENMSNWLNHASGLQEALSSILAFDIMIEITSDIKKFVEKASAMRNDIKRKRFIETTVKDVIRRFVPRLVESAIPIAAMATIITVLVTVFLLLLNTENRLVFDFASLTIRSILGITLLVDNSKDVIRLSSLFAGNAAVAKNLATAVTRGAVAVVGIVLDAIGIALTAVDISKGSKSPEAEKITDAVLQMREEANVLEKIYEAF